MCRSVTLFLALVCFFCTALFFRIASGQTLVFNTQDFPPFSYEIDNKVSGPAVEIIEAVCEKINVDCSFRLLPWTRAQKQVEWGEANAMFVIGWNKAREEWLFFTPPIMKTEYGFFVRDDNPLEFKDVSGIKGYTVGVYGPSNTSRTLEKIQTEVGNLVIDRQPDDESGFKKLAAGRVDAVFSNKAVGFAIINKFNLKKLRYAGRQMDLNYFIGFSKKFNDKALVDRFNSSFMELYKDGTVKEILDKYYLEQAVIE